jgi:hypothetical protein
MSTQENLKSPADRSIVAARWVLGLAAVFMVAAFWFPIDTGEEAAWVELKEYLPIMSMLDTLIAGGGSVWIVGLLFEILCFGAYGLVVLASPWMTSKLSRTPPILWVLRILVSGAGIYLLRVIETYQMERGEWPVFVMGIFAAIWIVFGLRRKRAIAWGLGLGFSVCTAAYFPIVIPDTNWRWDTGGWLLASVAVLELIGLLLIPTKRRKAMAAAQE